MHRSGPRARAALALFALVAAVLSPGLAAAGAGGAGPAPREVAAAVAFREKLGFRADRAFVGGTFGRAGFSTDEWGVPLDAAESAELGRRVKAEKALARALKAWARESESAGAYIDQRGGGVPVFLTTGDPAGAKRELAGLLPSGAGGAGARFARAARSMDDLVALQELVNLDLRAGALRALGVVSTSIDVRENAVRLGVAEDTAAVRSELSDRYGAGVVVAFEPPAEGGDACTSRNDCAPAKGGLEIRGTYNGALCTSSFLVRVVGSPHPRILTAGHCVGKSGGVGTSRTWNHHGQALAWAEYGHWINGGDADVAVLAPVTGAVSGDRNLLFRASPSDITSITGWKSNAEQIPGGLVCRAGAVSGYRCGTIELTNRTRDVDGKTIDHQWVVDFDACPGDSGGPYLLGGTAYGIHTDSSYGCNPGTNQAWYTPIGWALSVLASRGHPVALCTTATCGSDTNLWTTREPLDRSVWEPQLVELADDRILQVGGQPIEAIGPAAAGVEIPAPSVFDPVSGSWADVAAPPWTPADCGAQFALRLQDGRVLVGGGERLDSGDPDACADAWLFDPADGEDGSWSDAAAPPVELVSAGAALLQDGRAFVTGGSGATGSESVALAYDPDADEWATLAAAPAGALSPLVLRLPGGRVLVSGGYVLADGGAGGFQHVSATHLYDPGTGNWTATSAVGAYGRAGTVLADGRVILAGGQHLSWDGSQHVTFQAGVSVFTPSSSAWSTLPAMPSGRAHFTLAELPNGLLLAAGGRVPGNSAFGDLSRTAHAYDWGAKLWRTAPSLVQARAGQGSALLADGRVLVVGGGTASTETYVAGDLLPPSASTPSHALRSGASMTTPSIPIRLSWSASDVGGSGVGTYEVARSVDGGSFQTIATKALLPTFDTTVGTGHTYRFQIRPRDWAGNAGGWKAGSTFLVRLLQESSSSVTFSGTWKRLTVGGYTGGAVRYTKTAGASATFRFTGRGVSFISTRGPTLGSARIFVDGSYAGTVNLYSSSWQYRFVAFQRTWSSSGSHRITVIASGTSGHPRVDVDGFIVLAAP